MQPTGCGTAQSGISICHLTLKQALSRPIHSKLNGILCKLVKTVFILSILYVLSTTNLFWPWEALTNLEKLKCIPIRLCQSSSVGKECSFRKIVLNSVSDQSFRVGSNHSNLPLSSVSHPLLLLTFLILCSVWAIHFKNRPAFQSEKLRVIIWSERYDSSISTSEPTDENSWLNS